jgi:hypothetical protein
MSQQLSLQTFLFRTSSFTLYYVIYIITSSFTLCCAFVPHVPLTPAQAEGCVPGLRVTPGYLSQEEEEGIMQLAEDIIVGSGGGAVVTALKRRVTAHYGFEFDYKSRSVNPDAPLRNMPPLVQRLCERLYR